MKLYLGEIDDELFSVLARSAELGPWEPAVQLNGLSVGLSAWSKANATQREMILAFSERAMPRNGNAVAAIAKGFNRLDLLCDRKSLKAPGGEPCPAAPD